MLTLKHIICDGGFETLYEADQVRVKRADTLPNLDLGPIEFVAFDDRRGNLHTIRDGLVYVMNETGKTIAKYDFALDMKAAAQQVKNQISGLTGQGIGDPWADVAKNQRIFKTTTI